MPLIYITGIAGSGKSSVCEDLGQRGHKAYDTDSDGIAFFYHNGTGEAVTEKIAPEDRTLEWRSKHTWKAKREDVEKLATEAGDDLVFLCGVTSNDADELWDLFDKVFALHIDEASLKHRITHRTSNDYGKNPHEFADLLSWQRTAEADYKKLGATLVDATRPLNEVVDDILKQTNDLKSNDIQAYTEFTNSDLVAIYDSVNPIDSYASFYIELTKTLGTQNVIDLGCGTGLLSHELARQGCDVIGIEPAPAMLAQAKQKYGNEARWIVGSTEALRADMQADLVIMAGHVAQFFLTDDSWQQALQNIAQALKPGGYLAFESRNPQVQPFTDWPTKETSGKILSTPLGPVNWWPENLQYANDFAEYELHYRFNETGKNLISANKLRFRSQEELTKTLQGAGFVIEHTYGDWDSSLLKPDSREMIFVAKK